MKNLILFSVITFLVFGCLHSQTKSIDSTLKEYYDSSSIPSAIMGSIDADGNKTWHAFGPSVWNGKDTVNADNIFRIASMTKPIASVAALQLVERGLIGLDDPLNELMPEMVSIPILDEEGNLVQSDQAITLRQLLTHTSGFSYVWKSEKLKNFKKTDNWEYIDNPRIFEPGTDFRYGPSLDWAGRVVEKISGQDLETYIRENITGPLNMNSTWFNVPKDLEKNIVSWGRKDSTGAFNERPRIPEPVKSYSAGGGLLSSLNDYLKFLYCILNYGVYEGGRILKQETVEMMLTDNLPKDVDLTNGFIESDGFGLGWAIRAYENKFFLPVGSVYWTGGFNTYFALDANKKIAYVYFSNYTPHLEKDTFGFNKLFGKGVFDKIKE
ncbi:MAG: serine hydrolase domain-containing protein [Bacteroidota bacterium]